MRDDRVESPAREQRFNRRRLLAGAAGLAATMAVGQRATAASLSSSNLAGLRASVNGLEAVAWPPDLGQTPLQVYFKRTKHTLRGTMLDYWRAMGGRAVLGEPISEPFELGGYYSQAFERAILQYRPEYQYTEEPALRLAPLGPLVARLDGERPSTESWRAGGGGDRRGAVWAPLDPGGKSVGRALEQGGLFFETTGHALVGRFLDWYKANDGVYHLGAPISQAVKERGITRQYFEGGVLTDTPRGVALASLQKPLLSHLGVDLKPVEQGDLPFYDESLFLLNLNPNPVGPLDAQGRKWIEVSIGQQQLFAYQGSTLVATTLVSTGLAPNYTEEGVFYIRSKYPKQDMKGFTSTSGEVLGFGDAPSDTIAYEVTDVPNVMYINSQAEALHGAYWHNNFGAPMSHGCINQPLDFAAFNYGWAPLGTMVWVHA